MLEQHRAVTFIEQIHRDDEVKLPPVQSVWKRPCGDELNRLRDMARFVGKSFKSHCSNGISCVSHLRQFAGEQSLATPYLENALPGQEMNQMPEGLSAPAETIRRDRVPFRKILIPRLLTNGESLEKRLVCDSHSCPFLT